MKWISKVPHQQKEALFMGKDLLRLILRIIDFIKALVSRTPKPPTFQLKTPLGKPCEPQQY